MSTSATGRVVDETGTGLGKLGVIIEDISRQFDVNLKDTVTEDSGSFSLSYAADLVTSASAGQQIRTLRLRIKVGQHILKEIVQVDQPATDTLAFPSITIRRVDAESWWATLNSGQPSRLSDGNALSWLADNVDAWARVADVITSAKTLDVMQLTIDIGAVKRDDSTIPPLQENPVVVLRFDGDNMPATDNKLALTAGDQRIETLLFAAEQRNVPVRIQIPRMAIDKHGAVIIGLAAGSIVAGLAAVMLLGGIVGLVVGGLVLVVGLIFTIRKLIKLEQVFDTMFSEPKLVNWFQTVEKFVRDTNAGATMPPVRIRLLPMRSTMVTHAKMVNDRGVQGVLLGSPFEQDYFDSRDHRIDNPLRGASAGKGPIHDVSVGLRGPIVKDMHDLFKNHWDIADSSDILPAIDAPAPLTAATDGEFLNSGPVRPNARPDVHR